ncbi:MAG: 4Fe-4S dicluster domain-containing protein [Nitriliruptoraceae bacterium]
MSTPVAAPRTRVSVLPVAGLAQLLELLADDDYDVIGPTVRDGAIVHGPVGDVSDLPRGWGDEQAPGTYRLVRRDDDAYFGFAVGPSSAKRTLFPPRQPLWRAESRDDADFEIIEAERTTPRLALFGLRPCEVAAIAVQDRVLLQGVVEDEVYAANRSDLLLIAVECGAPAATCFCASMGTGPALEEGADLILTELLEGEHRFLVRAGTAAGDALLTRLAPGDASPEDLEARTRLLAAAADGLERHVDTSDLHDLLMSNLEHPRWDAIAERCLACANCTLVCPTCFCTTVEDRTDLAGTEATRERRWDSCFSLEFTHTGPASVRNSTRSRYRQWLTHKLATWVDQFDTSGCVGCGRCLTWCPVGIDLTEEVDVLRRTSEDTTSAPWPMVPSPLQEG